MVLQSWIEMILATQGQMLGTKPPEAWFPRVLPFIILGVQLLGPSEPGNSETSPCSEN